LEFKYNLLNVDWARTPDAWRSASICQCDADRTSAVTASQLMSLLVDGV